MPAAALETTSVQMISEGKRRIGPVECPTSTREAKSEGRGDYVPVSCCTDGVFTSCRLLMTTAWGLRPMYQLSRGFYFTYLDDDHG